MSTVIPDANILAWAVARHFQDKRLCGIAVEFGLGNGQRMDVLGMNYWGEILAAEVKVSRADWKSDIKVATYTHYCDYFWLAVPKGLITVAEFKEWRKYQYRPDGMGLMFVEFIRDRGFVEIAAKATRQRISMTNRCDVAFRMAARAGDPGFCPKCGYRATVRGAVDHA